MAGLIGPGQYLVTLTFPDLDGVAKDSVTWKWAFNLSAAIDPITIFDAIDHFLNVTPAGSTHPIAYYMAFQLDRGANKLQGKIFNITGALGVGQFHGTPVVTFTGTLGPAATGTQDLPAQLAVVLATNAQVTGILEHGPVETIASTEDAQDQGAPPTHTARSRPLSRTRGRMFIGPFNLAALGGPGDIVEPNLGLTVCHAATDLVGISVGLLAPWSVWSKVDAVLRPIVHGYCENKFGTQRRRREFAPARSNWP